MVVGAAPANAAPPYVTISPSSPAGAAPLMVTFEPSGDAATYHWQLGNGETADGPTAGATYVAGLWTATVTATAADGETTQARVTGRSGAVGGSGGAPRGPRGGGRPGAGARGAARGDQPPSGARSSGPSPASRSRF